MIYLTESRYITALQDNAKEGAEKTAQSKMAKKPRNKLADPTYASLQPKRPGGKKQA